MCLFSSIMFFFLSLVLLLSHSAAAASSSYIHLMCYLGAACTEKRDGDKKRLNDPTLQASASCERASVREWSKCKHSRAQSKLPSFGRNVCFFIFYLPNQDVCSFILNNIVHTSCAWLRARKICWRSIQATHRTNRKERKTTQ